MSEPKRPASDDAYVIETHYFDDEQGRRWGKVERCEGSTFRQYHYADKEWHPCAPGGLKKPYNLRNLVQATPETDVWITEGEKDADSLIALGLLATTNAEGALKFTMEHVPWFMGRARVFICQDNDDVGRRHAEVVARLLRPVVKDVRIVSFPELPEHGDVTDWLNAGGNKDLLIHRAMSAPSIVERVNAAPFLIPDPSTIPRREWLYPPHFVGGYVSLTLAPGGVGKSALLTTEALAMVSGKALLGVSPLKRLKVWSMNLEDPMDELQRRFTATAKYYGITEQDIGDRLFINSGRTMPLILGTDSSKGAKIDDAAVRDVISAIRANGINVWIVDPFVASHRLPENDNTKIDMVARAYAQIAEETGAAVMLVHHTRKMGPDRGTVDDGRGASSLLAAARSARLLTPMSSREATDAGIDERERRSYVRADQGKANLTPPAEAATWFRLQSVDLGNASRDLDHGDSVVVVTPFRYPSVEQPKVHMAELKRVLAKISDGGPWREDMRARDWVGYPIAEALLMGPLEGPTKRQVIKLVKEWLLAGVLVRTSGKDAKGNTRSFVIAGEIPPITEVRTADA